MSDNVAIKEGARAYNFTTDKIRTAQQNSDEPVIWVPESTVQLGSLHASGNGVYLAAAEELYGFNEIVVSVNGAATIGDQAVFPDDSGQLHEEYLPHAIVIVTPPNKLEYEDGQRIDLRGMVVIAVDENGHTWTNTKYPNGHIPLGELIIDPDHADESQAVQTATSELVEGGVAFGGGTTYYSRVDYLHYDVYTGGEISFAVASEQYPGVREYCVLAAREPFTETTYEIWTDMQKHNIETHQVTGYYEYNGKRAYLRSINRPISENVTGGPPENPYMDRDKAAWTCLYGDVQDAHQTITVTWRRYGDGAPLTTTFAISVIPAN